MKVVLYQTVRPQDGREALALGTYVVADVQWLHGPNEVDHSGLATFVVSEGEHAGLARRIGCVVPEEHAPARLATMLVFGVGHFETAARASADDVLSRARVLLAARHEASAGWGVKFIDKLLTERRG